MPAGEEITGVIPGTRFGPWYGKIYDIILTDRRLVLVYVRKWRLRDNYPAYHDDTRYVGVDAESLATRPGAISVPYMSVLHVRMKGARRENEGVHYLFLHYTGPAGKKRRLKVLLESPEKAKVVSARRPFMDWVFVPLEKDIVQLEYAKAVRRLLESSLPLSVRENARWELTRGNFKYVEMRLSGDVIRCPICDAGFGPLGVGVEQHVKRCHPEFHRRAVHGAIAVGLSVAGAVTVSATVASLLLLPGVMVGDALFFLFLLLLFVGATCGILTAAWWYRRTEGRFRDKWLSASIIKAR